MFDDAAEQVRILMDHMRHGIVVYDINERIRLINLHVHRIFDFAEGTVAVGDTLASYIDRVGRSVGWSDTRRQTVLNNHREWARQRQVKALDHHFDDGTVLEIGFNPLPGGGAVLTFVDVTHERTLRAASRKREALTLEAKVMLDRVGKIASNTRMVALNARIEAARLGGDGSAFAAVADEVRSLSKQTAEVLIEIGRINAASLNLS